MRIADLAILHFTHNALRTFGGMRYNAERRRDEARKWHSHETSRFFFSRF